MAADTVGAGDQAPDHSRGSSKSEGTWKPTFSAPGSTQDEEYVAGEIHQGVVSARGA